jgi:photosystem II stability/assembly factor-like uncharacterized protein
MIQQSIMKKVLLIAALFAFSTGINGQHWQRMMQEPGHNFYDIQKAFNEYWKDKDVTEKGNGYKPFKRWEHFMESRVYPSGNLSLVSENWKNFEEFSNTSHTMKMQASSTWTALGPMGSMSGLVNGLPRNAGRDNFITFHPALINTYWAGAPSGGLWSTSNNGTSWTTNTDNLSVIGCSDLAIDPATPNIMYLATGDGDASDTYCIGVLKSTDGGNSWNSTGLTFSVTQQRLMRRLVIDPSNTQVLLAATNNGIYRTSNAGVSWTLVSNFDAYDIEFKPGDASVVYAAGQGFYRSSDNGQSFSFITNGIASNGLNRMSIAVTAADPAYVYVVCSNSSNSSLVGVYRSVNSGTSFATMATTPNLLGNNCNGSSTSGQGWYDLAIASSPLNKDEVAVGGVNVWRSTTGGTSWTCIGCWNQPTTPPYVHADIHDLDYTSTGILYAACDGGIFSFNGSAWTNRTGTRNIAQIYKLGLSSLSPYRWITGHQDNGTNVYTGTSYSAAIGGDGMDCFIDRTNDNNMYGSLYYGDFRRSQNGGVSWSVITTGMTGNAPWVSPWKQDPQNASRLYAGRSQLFVSNNLGASWSQAGTIGSSGYIEEFAIAPSNNQVIYVIRGSYIYKTTDGCATWTNVSGNLPIFSAQASFISVHATDPNTAWVTFSGYFAGNKVFRTTNGGSTWTNISGNLPNLPANCSVYQPGTAGLIYVGMDVGIYYRDNSSSNWTLYNNGLPNVPISDLEISPAAATKLRAATYGRGVWEVDVVLPSTVPSSNFTYSGVLCSGVPKNFTDQSSENPVAWNWSVSPPTGVMLSSSTAQNPAITFPASGSYVVSLTASNTVGTGNTYTQSITVNPSPTLSFNTTSVVCLGDDLTITVSGADSYTWFPGPIVSSSIGYSVTGAANFSVIAMNTNGCGTNTVLQLVADECVPVKGSSGAEGFNLFPNPARNTVLLRAMNPQVKFSEVSVTDVSGKLVLFYSNKTAGNKQELTMDISSLASGVYQVKINAETGSPVILRLVKE